MGVCGGEYVGVHPIRRFKLTESSSQVFLVEQEEVM